MLKYVSRITLAVLFCLLAALPAGAAGRFRQAALEIVKQNGESVEFQVDVADTPELRRLGLMHRPHLPEKSGMFMDFESDQVMNMWMKNTVVPLDMLFADAHGVIFLIAEDTAPYSLATISSGQPGRYVLEIPAGSARRFSIRPGDRLRLRNVR